MGKNKTIADRQQYVVKANSLIRTRYRLTLQQQRLVLFCISKIRPQDMIGQEYTFTIEEICNEKELTRLLNQFLASLDQQSRVMFVRRYFFADSISEIAVMFQISNHNATVRLSYKSFHGLIFGFKSHVS